MPDVNKRASDIIAWGEKVSRHAVNSIHMLGCVLRVCCMNA